MIDKPTLHEVGYKTYMINCFGLQSPTLIVGEEQALLIDTAVGNCDLLEVVRRVTDLPLTVAITHCHLDHIGGIGQFDAVYVPKADMEGINTFDPGILDDYMSRSVKDGQCGSFTVPSRTSPWKKPSKLIPMDDGCMFDLGGRKVTAYDCHGHTRGQMVFIDDASRILFSGDAVNTNLLLAALSVDSALRGLLHVKDQQSKFDRNFTGHLGFHGNLESSISNGPDVLDTCIEICRGILDGTMAGESTVYTLFPDRAAFILKNGVRVTYNPGYLFEKA